VHEQKRVCQVSRTSFELLRVVKATVWAKVLSHVLLLLVTGSR
jgi:hypothetical protein